GRSQLPPASHPFSGLCTDRMEKTAGFPSVLATDQDGYFVIAPFSSSNLGAVQPCERAPSTPCHWVCPEIFFGAWPYFLDFPIRATVTHAQPFFLTPTAAALPYSFDRSSLFCSIPNNFGSGSSHRRHANIGFY